MIELVRIYNFYPDLSASLTLQLERSAYYGIQDIAQKPDAKKDIRYRRYCSDTFMKYTNL